MLLWCLITNIEGNMKKKKKIEEEIEKLEKKEVCTESCLNIAKCTQNNK